ncbi:uncharacterized protein LOC135840601 [Planococcus citri]|uniref:uncharacterized protein LOC135840601 n=1 Tax=Planococcus citri TaxID=170843 RepID=UPI0031F97B23
MPSREEMFFLPENENNTSQDFLSRDIENLVSEIKENLRLSGFKTRHQRRIVRPSPYSNPSRSLSDCCESCVKNSCNDYSIKANVTCAHRTIKNMSLIKSSSSSDDPYEMLQELLKDGGLIKEAVRRLQKGLSPKQRYYYDSDEESSRSPLHLYRNVEV